MNLAADLALPGALSLPAHRTLYRDGNVVSVLDQTALPFEVRRVRIEGLKQMAAAISGMQLRGAPLIGVAAAHGVALAMQADASDAALAAALALLGATRPTAVNLHWALARMAARLQPLSEDERAAAAWQEAEAIAAHEAATSAAIGDHGLAWLRSRLAGREERPLRLMTHCNAGALATVGIGTALAPIYAAQAAGLAVEVWVSETRPRNQGLLTAWELEQAGVPHTLIADNAAGVLLARGEVDAVIVGADRIARNGDCANKVGTYLKALAARDCGVPFVVAAPMSTVDFACPDGTAIPIESRDADELRLLAGLDAAGRPQRLRQSRAAVCNPAFDVTPARLVDAIITEDGVFAPAAIAGLAR